MKKSNSTFIVLPLLVILLLIVVFGFQYLYSNNEAFRTLFGATPTPPEVNLQTLDAANLGANPTPADPNDGKLLSAANGSLISFYIFTGLLCIQIFVFAIGFVVLSKIRSSDLPVEVRLKKLDNADIFMDLPLYVGLFGTVSSFLVMTFSPVSSQLIAYSSTLIGIIFSVILKLTLLYPTRNALLEKNNK
ncbi:MAG: hypothetical protein RRY34_07045 [Victivallaceae bacterium]